MPLIVPTEFVHLGFGGRLSSLRGGQGWDADEPGLVDPKIQENIRLTALPFLSGVAEPRDAASWLVAQDLGPNSIFARGRGLFGACGRSHWSEPNISGP